MPKRKVKKCLFILIAAISILLLVWGMYSGDLSQIRLEGGTL